MSQTFEIDDQISLGFFFGGKGRGRMVQITGWDKEKQDYSYIQLSMLQIEKLIKIYRKNRKFKPTKNWKHYL